VLVKAPELYRQPGQKKLEENEEEEEFF